MSQKAYFLAPSIDYAPDQLIKIGQIVTSLKTPYMAIAPPLSLDPPIIHCAHQLNWEEERSRSINGSVGIWTKFLGIILGIGADLAGNLERSSNTVWKFERLDTFFIVPDEEFINASMDNAEVKKFFGKNPKQPAFMITGVKIARGASLTRKFEKAVGADGNVGVDGTTTGVPVSMGPKASIKRETAEIESFSGSSDFVFAYRVIKIYKHPKTGVVSSKEEVKGALYEHGSSLPTPSSPIDIEAKLPVPASQQFEVDGFDKQDIGLTSAPNTFQKATFRDGVDDGMCEVLWIE